MEREREEQGRRSKLVSVVLLVVGFLAGYGIGTVVSLVVASHHVFDFPVGSCDYFLVAPSVPAVPVSGVNVCYTELNIPVNLVVCPTKYTLALHTVPEINSDSLRQAKDWCDSVRDYVEQQVLRRELNRVGGDQNTS